MADDVTPVMHRHSISTFESRIASVRNQNIIPEYPNPDSLIPSDLFNSLPQQPPSGPSSTYSTPPSAAKDTYAMSSTPGPKTPLYPSSTQPPSQCISRLLALLQHQQWLHCPEEQAEIWKPRKNEIEYLNHKLNKNIRSPPLTPLTTARKITREVQTQSKDKKEKEKEKEKERK